MILKGKKLKEFIDWYKKEKINNFLNIVMSIRHKLKKTIKWQN